MQKGRVKLARASQITEKKVRVEGGRERREGGRRGREKRVGDQGSRTNTLAQT